MKADDEAEAELRDAKRAVRAAQEVFPSLLRACKTDGHIMCKAIIVLLRVTTDAQAHGNEERRAKAYASIIGLLCHAAIGEPLGSLLGVEPDPEKFVS